MSTATSSPSDNGTSQPTGMSRAEVRAGASLASIFALRMLGLFILYPIFAIYAKGLPDGDNATLIGVAMGAYGASQSLLQLLFGMASDKYGRKPVIVTGLLLFALGAFVSAQAHTVLGIAIGRAIQGAGAISAAITALIADATREEHRTKAMAMVGGSIGVSFAVAMVAAPALYQAIGMDGIFLGTSMLALAAIAVVLFVVPDVPLQKAARVPFAVVLKNRELMRLNLGVFVLHLSQVAMFIVVPEALVKYAGLPLASHWKVYLPVMFGSFIAMLPAIIAGEKRGKMKQVFLVAIGLLLASQLGLSEWGSQPLALMGLLFVFFVAFNILEASQPSLVSRMAPPAEKGTALGVYNTMQSLGLACGGPAGAYVNSHWGAPGVFAITAALSLVWLIISLSMPELPRRAKAAQAV